MGKHGVNADIELLHSQRIDICGFLFSANSVDDRKTHYLKSYAPSLNVSISVDQHASLY
jgi:hypothetical protein